MKAFVLAAGLGTRLRPLTNHSPKPLMPVLNVPSLFYTLFLLKEAGIGEVICNIHYHAAQMRSVVEAHNLAGLQITFSEEPEILGTGGGLKKCEALLEGEDFVLVNSDIITSIDFRALIERHRISGNLGTLALYETPDAASIGWVGVEDGLVKDFRNQRHTNLFSSFIYTGTAVLSPDIFRYMHAEYSSIVDTGFAALLERNSLGYYEHCGLWMDVGTLPHYWQANLDATGAIRRTFGAMQQSFGVAPHVVAPSATISPAATVENSVVGADCVIPDGCTVRNSVLLSGVVLQPNTPLCNAIADSQTVTILEPSSLL
uniref:Nucleotidyltransferase n=1 Tax=Chlorobium chlorochromatii (strain CaD3) TaxID=340177 RepID=Q3AU54_CHLCH